MSKCRSVIRGVLPSAVLSPASSGMYLAIGSSRESLPSSISISTAVAVIGFDMDAIQKIESTRMKDLCSWVGPTLSVHPKHRVTRRDHRDRAWNFVGDDHVVHARRNGIEAGSSLGKSERKREKNYS